MILNYVTVDPLHPSTMSSFFNFFFTSASSTTGATGLGMSHGRATSLTFSTISETTTSSSPMTIPSPSPSARLMMSDRGTN